MQQVGGKTKKRKKKKTNLSGEIEFSVERLKVLDSITRHEFLVQPDFVIGGRLRNEMVAQLLGEFEDLRVQLRKRWDRRADNVSKTKQ